MPAPMHTQACWMNLFCPRLFPLNAPCRCPMSAMKGCLSTGRTDRLVCEALPTATAVHKTPSEEHTYWHGPSGTFCEVPTRTEEKVAPVTGDLLRLARLRYVLQERFQQATSLSFWWFVGVASVCPLRDHSRLVVVA